MEILTIVSFLFFTGLVGLITWWLTRRDDHQSSDGYFLGGRTLTGGFIAGSLLLTNLSTEQLVGLNGDAYTHGLSVMAWEVVSAISLVAMALFFLPRYLRSGISTVPEFFEQRFDATTRTITSLIFIFAYAGVLLPIILYSGARGLTGILNIREMFSLPSETFTLWLTVWVIGVIGSIYAIFGGLRTVAVSDTLNGFGLLVGGLLIAWLGLQAVNPENPFGALAELREQHPDKFNSIGGPDAAVPFSTLFSGVFLLTLFYWSTNQQIIQRTFGASSLKEGQKGVLFAAFVKILAPIIVVLPGIIAFHLYAGEQLPQDQAYGRLVYQVLPAPLRGFFAAVVVGAILSSFNSALNSTATLFSLSAYKPLFRPTASETEVIRAGKIFGCLIAIAAMSTAPLLASQPSIFGYLQKMNGLYFIPLLSVMVVGLLTKRVPAIAANVGLILGFAAISLGYFVPRYNEYVSVVGEFHFLGIVFASLIGLMLLIGALSPRSRPWEHKDARAVDLTRWPLATPLGLGVIATVLGVYIYFADFEAAYAPAPGEQAAEVAEP